MRMVADAIRGLLAVDHLEPPENWTEPVDGDSSSEEKPDLLIQEPKIATEPSSEFAITTATIPDPSPEAPPPGTGLTYAWKRFEGSQISQDIYAATPEDLFQKAGFRPFRVHDPIQGFLCVQVEWRDERWGEILGSA